MERLCTFQPLEAQAAATRLDSVRASSAEQQSAVQAPHDLTSAGLWGQVRGERDEYLGDDGGNADDQRGDEEDAEPWSRAGQRKNKPSA
jgi:hypothetical protein